MEDAVRTIPARMLGAVVVGWLAWGGAWAQDPGATGYETPGPIDAARFIPAAMMRGPHHRVEPSATHDGFTITYTIRSDYGTYEVTGTEMAMERIVEIGAIAKLKEVKTGEEFGKALARTGGDKLKAAGSTIMNPFRAIANVPKGASRFFGRMGEGMKGERSQYEGKAYKNILGESSARKRLAMELGVNPYSTNEQLQSEMESVAWVYAGVGLGVNLGLTVGTSGIAGIAVTATSLNSDIKKVLSESTPEDLRIINRKKLIALKVDEELREKFLRHPWYSPWHETLITDALATVGVDPAQFLAVAIAAEDEADAYYFQRIAQLIAYHHRTISPIVAIAANSQLVTTLDQRGQFTIPIHLDYCIWTARTEGRAKQVVAVLKEGLYKSASFETTGRVSPRLVSEMKNCGIEVREGLLDVAGAPESPAAR